jgi:hypothetical protein
MDCKDINIGCEFCSRLGQCLKPAIGFMIYQNITVPCPKDCLNCSAPGVCGQCAPEAVQLSNKCYSNHHFFLFQNFNLTLKSRTLR